MSHREDNSLSIDFEHLLAACRRQLRLVALSAVCGVILGVCYLLTAVPLYTATTSVLIDRENRAIADQLSALGSVSDDEPAVLSQVELLKSDTISLAVVDKLNLTRDPVFRRSRNSLIGFAGAISDKIFEMVKYAGLYLGTHGDPSSERYASGRDLQEDLSVSRVGRSYVLEISYVSASPDLAARVASAVADTYLTDKLEAKFQATRRAGTWLQERIEELRQRSLETDLAVQKFRTANGLVSAGDRLVSDQQLTELNSALIVAQADTAKAQANLARVKEILSQGQSDAIVTDLLESSVSNKLREKYLEASKREAEIADRLGPNHVQAVRLRGEMREYSRLMFEELARIAESYQSDLEVAQSRERSLTESVAQATGISASANETKVQLRELEREAETYKNLYQTFLQRYQEAMQQQSFPVTEARVISVATTPDKPSHPKKILVLTLGLMLGTVVGAGAGAFREFRDRFFRTGDQVRSILGLEYLGIAPLIENDPKLAASTAEEQHPRALRKRSSISNYVIDYPLSSFAETMRSAKIAADLSFPNKTSKTIGVVSVLPGEGKSTVAINFAELLAMQGAKTVLIDADMRNPGSTRAIAPHADAGLLEAVMEGRSVKDVLLINQKTKLAFLPAVVRRLIPHSSELLASVGMTQILSNLAQNAEYIILDLPPLGPVVDARAIAPKVDGFIFVVEWGKTARTVVQQVLESEPIIAGKCLGVILNKVDSDMMKLYREYGSAEYYHSQYASYYHKN